MLPPLLLPCRFSWTWVVLFLAISPSIFHLCNSHYLDSRSEAKRRHLREKVRDMYVYNLQLLGRRLQLRCLLIWARQLFALLTTQRKISDFGQFREILGVLILSFLDGIVFEFRYVANVRQLNPFLFELLGDWIYLNWAYVKLPQRFGFSWGTVYFFMLLKIQVPKNMPSTAERSTLKAFCFQI